MLYFLVAALVAFVSLVSALPVARDVWTPPITSPNASTVWVAGGNYTVTWNISSQPSRVTNPSGLVYLRHDDATQSRPLAQGFPLSAGEVNVTIPADTQADTDWIIVLFGDSGNWSPPFTILAPTS